ncbi:uncharacterized protein LOC5504842 [Nematostella vectensis]|uniref:uncharacterized protein LOC5504842 n=1 Tax=Nematostella vectensis TaxID=45351 RepID=UPI00207771AC|nr:uncharacterized protein LOC5504842 [Nematostella vectensis]
MPKQLVLILICFLSIRAIDAASSSTWIWSQYNKSVCINDGEEATLTWKVTLNSGEQIGAVEIWQQAVAGGSPVKMYSTVSDRPEPVFADRMMSVSHTGSTPTYNVVFTLKVIKSKDGFGANKIQCRVTANNFHTGQPPLETLLNVQAPISKLSVIVPSAVNESDSVRMTCQAEGSPDPKPTFRWFNAKGEEIGNDSFYTVPSVHRDRPGPYTCLATDGCGHIHRSNATLTVQYKPDFTKLTKKSPAQDTVCLNASITLTCSASAVPTVSSYIFYNNNVMLVTQSDSEYVAKATNEGINTFTCVPVNIVGKGASSSVIVTAKEGPVIAAFNSSNLVVVEGASVNLYCHATGTSPLEVTLQRYNSQASSPLSNSTSYTFSAIKKNDQGDYMCSATNGDECAIARKLLRIKVDYVNFIKPPNLCKTKDALDVTITLATNLETRPFVMCNTGEARVLAFPAQSGSKNATYAMKATDGENVTCSVEGFPLGRVTYYLGQNTTVVMTFTISNRETTVTDGRYNVSGTVWRDINLLISDVLGSCLRDYQLSFRPGSLIVDVTYTLTGDVKDPQTFFKEGLIGNAPKYNFTIVPESIQPLQTFMTHHTPSPVTAKSGLTTEDIILIVVGIVIFLLVVIIVTYCVCTKGKRRKKEDRKKMYEDGRDTEGPSPYAQDGPAAEYPVKKRERKKTPTKPNQEMILEVDAGQRDDDADSYDEAIRKSYQGPPYAEISHVPNNAYSTDTNRSNKSTLPKKCFPPGPPSLNLGPRDVTDTSIKVRWTPPTNNGGGRIRDYKVEVGSLVVEGVTSTSLLCPDLKPYTKYLVRVYARNAAGMGTAALQYVTTNRPRGGTLPTGSTNAAYSNNAYGPEWDTESEEYIC